MPDTVARRMITGLQGQQPTVAEAAWLRRRRPAGVILFGRNVADPVQLRRLCAQVRAHSPGSMICADHEGGAVSQLAGALGRPPAAWGLGVLDDPDLTRRVHRESGLRLAAVGIDRILGPVADILCERHNPVIGARAFGADADLVARHVCAAVAGYREAGLRVCVKHWPGHGGTLVDSHLGLPGESCAGPQTAAQAEVPFLAAVRAGADGLMVGHLPVPGAAAELARLPATLNARALGDLRRRLAACGGGDGRPDLLLFADDVTMGALRPGMRDRGVADPDGHSGGLIAPEDLPAAWLEVLAAAGCDYLLCRGIPWRALPAPADAGGRVEEPAALAADQAGAVGPPDPAGLSDPAGLPEAPAYQEARRRLAQRNLPADFFAEARDLLWLDASAQDRWQAAAGPAGSGTASLAAVLQARFRSIRTAAEPGQGLAYSRLLVTSHRPWPTDRWAGTLADSGVCLVMGHPSLAQDVADLLPADWRVGSLFDICGEDLPG